MIPEVQLLEGPQVMVEFVEPVQLGLIKHVRASSLRKPTGTQV